MYKQSGKSGTHSQPVIVPQEREDYGLSAGYEKLETALFIVILFLCGVLALAFALPQILAQLGVV